jgi:hypothetical protein
MRWKCSGEATFASAPFLSRALWKSDETPMTLLGRRRESKRRRNDGGQSFQYSSTVPLDENRLHDESQL